MTSNIGLGVITCDRPASCFKVLESLPWQRLGKVVLINDGSVESISQINFRKYGSLEIMQNERNLGVGRSKNRALKALLRARVEHLFLMEDDIYVKNPSVFERYVDAAQISGIQHLNYSQHGLKNKNSKGNPDPATVVDYGPLRVALHRHCVGAFSYYSSGCLETVGLMDEDFYNGGEHLEHTYRIIRAGLHPPFWFFADTECSEELLGDEPWSINQSRIASRGDSAQLVQRSDAIFQAKHGRPIGRIPVSSPRQVMRFLRKLQNRMRGDGRFRPKAIGLWRPQPSRRNLLDKLRDRILGRKQTSDDNSI